jgi:formamidopyrimidine-DNA glycosylase
VPELPEVETVVRDLRPYVRRRKIVNVRVGRRPLRLPWRASWNRHIIGRTLVSVRRRGKWILLELEGDSYLVIHLGMTGQLTAAPAAAPLENHTHVVFTLDGPRQLRFRDIRRFGSATFFPDPDALDAFFLASGLGPEPFDLSAECWREKLLRTRRSLKAILLDQRVVAGVGNIYADESLFEAGLHPARAGASLAPEEAERLRHAIVAVLEKAIRLRGSSIRDYVGGSGLKGGFQEEFCVYGREGLPCPRCGTAIVRVRLAGRSTHLCPSCQTRNGTISRRQRA